MAPRRSHCIALLTDIGTMDHYAGAVTGAILSLNPTALIVYLPPEITPRHIDRGIYIRWSSGASFPSGTMFVGVIDPGIGCHREKRIPLKVGAS